MNTEEKERRALLVRLDAEADALARMGYQFPALFAAVKFLLEHAALMPDHVDDV